MSTLLWTSLTLVYQDAIDAFQHTEGRTSKRGMQKVNEQLRRASRKGLKSLPGWAGRCGPDGLRCRRSTSVEAHRTVRSKRSTVVTSTYAVSLRASATSPATSHEASSKRLVGMPPPYGTRGTRSSAAAGTRRSKSMRTAAFGTRWRSDSRTYGRDVLESGSLSRAGVRHAHLRPGPRDRTHGAAPGAPAFLTVDVLRRPLDSRPVTAIRPAVGEQPFPEHHFNCPQKNPQSCDYRDDVPAPSGRCYCALAVGQRLTRSDHIQEPTADLEDASCRSVPECGLCHRTSALSAIDSAESSQPNSPAATSMR